MLTNLHVKNFAIIDEIDIDFGKHLNILTGETGAGKSILIGSISIALGARVSSKMIGRNGDYAMVEIVFQMENEHILQQIRELDVEPEDGQIVISRKIMDNRSINKINGESVPVSVIRKVGALCIDIHGQHEHQSLLNCERHKEIVDEYGGEKTLSMKGEIAALYKEYSSLKKELDEEAVSEEERERQVGFLEYEREEITKAALKPEEMECLEEDFQRASHAGTIVESLGQVYSLSTETALTAVSHGLKRLHEIQSLDASVAEFAEELMQIESLLSDFNHEVSSFMDDFTFDENELIQMQNRLDLIHSLQSRYGETYEDIMTYLQNVEEKLEQYEDYENYRQRKQDKLAQLEETLKKHCDALSDYRKNIALQLQELITGALEDLNFAHVDFEIKVTKKEHFSADGQDDVEFMIATNPGEPKRSLGKVVSGGELSRIMLAIKSVFADSDQIETLIFDEIDTGISGRTAQKVSEKMGLLGVNHQIICITHLAQIAAMADYHYVIEKEVKESSSSTSIRLLEGRETEEELARILGGVEITDAVRKSAKEMKKMAQELKQSQR